MISKNRCKFLNVFIYLFILIILNFPHEGHAQIFLSEDWDSGTPPTDWPCKNFPNAYTTNTFNGWASKDYDLTTFGDAGKLSGLSTTIYHSPPRSYYQHRPANNYATCDIMKNFPQPYPTKIYVRFYIYFTSNWSNFDNLPTTTGEVVHLILLNFLSAGSGFYFDIWDYASLVWPYKCSYATTGMWPQMYFIVQSNTTPGGNDTAPDDCYNLSQHLNEWLSVEFMADAANDRFSMWINGTQKVNNVYMSISQSDFNKIMISGWNSILRNYTGDFYIDDIVVSDSYIGSGSGDTQAPTVPAGLSAQVFSNSQINLSWTAATDNVGVTGYRVYRNGTQIATSATNSYSNTGLSASTTYTYAVSAYDAAGNASSQSGSTSATTLAGGGDTGGNTGGSGGDSSASGGSGCGFVKDGGKGQGAKGEGLAFAMMLIVALTGIALFKRRLSNIRLHKKERADI